MLEEKDYPAPPEYVDFKRKVRSLTGVDLDAYKYQIHRRVHMLMQRWGMRSYDDYFNAIKNDEKRLREFLDYLTINVSEFFRNPNKFEELEARVIPMLLEGKARRQLKAWSAGCATGEEPYSLAIIFEDLGIAREPRILATDIDKTALAIAQKGIYAKKQLANVSQERIARHFTPLGDDLYEVKPHVKDRVRFQQQDLLKDPFDKDFDLILCRNVVIYFRPEAKDMLYRKFQEALRPGGVLMVGGTEQIFNYRELGFKSAGPFLYQKA